MHRPMRMRSGCEDMTPSNMLKIFVDRLTATFQKRDVGCSASASDFFRSKYGRNYANFFRRIFCRPTPPVAIKMLTAITPAPVCVSFFCLVSFTAEGCLGGFVVDGGGRGGVIGR